MYSFSQLLVEADLTGSDEKRQALLENYLSKTDSASACWTVYLLSDKQRTRYIHSDELKKHFMVYAEMPEWLFDASNNHVDDIAECISLILTDTKASQSVTHDIIIENILNHQLPNFKKLATLEEKKIQLSKWWQEFSGHEIYVLNKLLTGSFRGGNLKPLLIPALASILEKSQATITYKLSGKYKPSAEFYESLKASDANPSEPYALQEAQQWTDEVSPNSFNTLQFEYKYDGIRAQLIKRDDQVFLWSKEQQLLNEQFPDVVEAGAGLENGTVLDGEIVGWKDSQVTMMNGLRGRLERKKPTKQLIQDSQTHYKTFDLLEHQNESTDNLSFQERRTVLKGIILPDNISLCQTINIGSENDLKLHIKTVRKNNADGIIIRNNTKDKNNFWSYKAPAHTLKAILTYVQGYTLSFSLRNNNELITFTKVENYLSTNVDLKAWIKANSLERFGPVTSVKAEQVFELSFDSIMESKRHKSGLNVKNAQVVAWRQDLSIDDVDSLEVAKGLLD